MHSLQAFLVEAEKILSAANSVGSTLQLDTNQETELQGALTSLFEGLWRDTWANVSFETLSDKTNSQLEESAFRIALGLLKQETPEGIRKVAFQLCACLTKVPALASQFLRDGCLKEVFKKTVYQTEAAVIVRHLLEEDPHTLKTCMVLEIKQTFNEMETLKDNDWNLSDNFLRKMAHVISRGPLLFLEAVAWTCVLETAWAEDEFFIDLSKSKINNQLQFFSGECSGRHETISSNFTRVLHDLADILLSLFAEQKLEGATVILNLLGGLCFIYIHSVGIIVHRDADISTSTLSKGIFYSIIHSTLLLTPPSTMGCKHELSGKGSSFLLAVCRLSTEGRTRVMEALSNVLSDFFESSSASNNGALFPVRKFAPIAMFLEKILLVRKEAADGDNKTLLPDHDASKMGRRLVNSLLEMVQLVDTKGSEDFQFSVNVLQSLYLISNACRESCDHIISPSEVILCDVESINFQDGNQENLFSFRQPVTLKWEPIKDEVHVDTLSKLLETRMWNANEVLLFIRKLEQKLGETSSSDLSAQQIIQDVKSSQRQEDEVDGQQHGIKQEHQPLLSPDDLNIFLRCLLRAPVNISHMLDNDQELVKTHFFLSGLLERNNEHFARSLLDVLHAEMKTSISDQMVISWVLLLLKRLVMITKHILDVFSVRDLALLLKLLNLQSEEPLMLLVMYFIELLVSRATRQMGDETSKCSLDELQPSDLQNLCIFFCKKGITDELFYLALDVMQDLSRSHETRREFFVLRLSEIAGTLIKDDSVNCWRVIDLLDLLNLLIEKEDLGRPNLINLESIWKLVCEYMGELGGEATSSHLHVISSFFRFCDITEEHHVHVEFAERYKIMLNQFMTNDIYLLDSSFSLLLKTPELIDFPNKKKYFMAKVFEGVSRSFERRKLDLHIQRDQVFRQSYSRFENGQKLDLGSVIDVSFEGENGIDFGGLTREWFRLMSKAIIVQRNKGDALQPENLDKDEKEPELFSAADCSVTYQPNPKSCVQTSYYTFIGHVVAFALLSNNIMDVTFTPSFYKHMNGADITYHDMEGMDHVLYQGWENLLQNPALMESVDLWFRDNKTKVTKENLQEYIDEEANYYMTGAIDDKRLAFLQGFHDLIPKKHVTIFTAEELRLAMSGMPTIEVEALKQTSTYVNYVEDDIVIQWFWEVLASFEHKDKAMFLGFVTGTPRVPAEGLKLIIMRNVDPDQLPTGHTCAKQLDLPGYSSKEQLKEKLLCAIQECDNFGFV